DLLKTHNNQVYSRIEALLEEKKSLEKTIKDLREKLLSGSNEAGSIKTIKGAKLMVKDAGDTPTHELKSLVDQFKAQIKSGVVVATSGVDEKISIIIGVTSDLTTKLNAVEFARLAAELLGGKGGGGRPDLAQAGGTNKSNLSKVIEEIEKRIETSL
ncbi:MAG: DHHA1 domain-containing protein, partial [Candidatus Nucleicultricaceae bacterium]